MLFLLASAVLGMLMPKPANREELLGQSTARMIFAIIGIVLIVMHFAKSKKDGR